jgi:hypothetical protein
MEPTATGSTEHRHSGKSQPGKPLSHPLVVVDLDEPQSSLHVKRLRKGQGKLMTHVERIINDLIEAGTVKGTAQPVVIVVRETPASFLGFGDDD